jgi:hypothetical protein
LLKDYGVSEGATIKARWAADVENTRREKAQVEGMMERLRSEHDDTERKSLTRLALDTPRQSRMWGKHSDLGDGEGAPAAARQHFLDAGVWREGKPRRLSSAFRSESTTHTPAASRRTSFGSDNNSLGNSSGNGNGNPTDKTGQRRRPNQREKEGLEGLIQFPAGPSDRGEPVATSSV